MQNKFDKVALKRTGDYVRYLSLMGIQYANSGHPGLPLGCADIGAILYGRLMKYNSAKPNWINRDRFVLSAGHGSMFIYSLLHLAGYPFTLKDLSNFRQFKSITAGHPEYNIHEGIEITTGPLGQGISNAVGMAIEGKMLAARFNKKNYELFDYNVFTILGDGCHMEGISYEAQSVAGHLGLDNLIAIYDDNNITIDGNTSITFTEDIIKRYEGCGWDIETAVADNIEDVYKKLEALKNLKNGKPKVLIAKTTIGNGLDKLKGSHKIHGAPAGVDEIAYFMANSSLKDLFEKEYGSSDIAKLKEIVAKALAEKKDLLSDKATLQFMKEAIDENASICKKWYETLEAYKKEYSTDYALLESLINGKVPETLKDKLINYKIDKATEATRNISAAVLAICASEMPSIIGGAADLVESTKATVKGDKYITKDDFSGRNIAFGIREHSMGAIANGIAANRLFIPFTSTFFVFSDYMRTPIRLSALMNMKHLFVFTHDSIYVGEDGPTHQPIEHINSLRLIPNITIFRPGSDMEMAFSYLYFLEHDKPTVIIGSRQNMEECVMAKTFDRVKKYEAFKKGAYVFHETEQGKADIILMASGSEVGIAFEAGKKLEADGKKVRVVSIPSLEIFSEQECSYKQSLMGKEEPIVFVEASSQRAVNAFYDKRITTVSIEEFGMSGPAKKVAEHFGFTTDNVYNKAKSVL